MAIDETSESSIVQVAAEVLETVGVDVSFFESICTDSLEHQLAALVEIDGGLLCKEEQLSRAEIAYALSLVLAVDLLARVPSGAAYVGERVRSGRRIFLDHGAVRTIARVSPSVAFVGREQVARFLEPLGYFQNFTYDLASLKMTGYSYTHEDAPETISQWFVSEIDPSRFSDVFLETVDRFWSTAVDPLSEEQKSILEKLSVEQALTRSESVSLLCGIFACVGRIHQFPSVSDYEILLAESPEMAWISTEGTVLNHITDRVDDVVAVAEQEKQRGRSIKEKLEVSGSGRVMQTAHKADLVARELKAADGSNSKMEVPGSFFEFIQRASFFDEKLQKETVDLAFDASNAQGIFGMTR